MQGEAKPAARRTRVVLVDDEPLVRQGLTLLLELEPDLLVCGAEESETEAAQRIPGLNPDVVVVDLCLKQGTGLNLIKQLRQRCPKLKIIVFSMYDQAHYVGRAFAEGAHGYVVKEEGGERLVEAIHAVLGGKFYLSEAMAARTPSLVPGPAPRHIRRHV
jgi:DNA-binding NarL/FixJ family response regulator